MRHFAGSEGFIISGFLREPHHGNIHARDYFLHIQQLLLSIGSVRDCKYTRFRRC